MLPELSDHTALLAALQLKSCEYHSAPITLLKRHTSRLNEEQSSSNYMMLQSLQLCRVMV
jgi:hypothetical protein